MVAILLSSPLSGMCASIGYVPSIGYMCLYRVCVPHVPDGGRYAWDKYKSMVDTMTHSYISYTWEAMTSPAMSVGYVCRYAWGMYDCMLDTMTHSYVLYTWEAMTSPVVWVGYVCHYAWGMYDCMLDTVTHSYMSYAWEALTCPAVSVGNVCHDTFICVP